MSAAFDSIKQELLEAIEHAETGATTEVTLWLDVDVVDKFRASGEGWQTRINDALKSWVQTHAQKNAKPWRDSQGKTDGAGRW